MILLLLCLLSTTQKQIGDKPIILDGSTDAYAAQYIFVSTQFGLYSFDRTAETFRKIIQESNNNILGLDDGIIWTTTADGLASADVRINDWRIDKSHGAIEGLGFDDNFVWIGSDSGLSRFDKFQETWQPISKLKVNCLLAERSYLWLATDSGIWRYNQEFEKIEPVPAPKLGYSYIINNPNRIWFLAKEHLVAYEKNTENWSTFPAVEITDYSGLGDSLFVVSHNQVYLYEPNANAWLEFRDVPEIKKANGISVNGENILFALDDGLLVYNWADKNRKIYNRSNGLETDSLIDVYEDSKFIIAVSHYAFDYLNKETGIWKVEKIIPTKSKGERFFYLDETGGHAPLTKGIDLTLIGRAAYARTRAFPAGAQSEQENTNLNLSGQHKTGRLFSMYYDDSDQDQIVYGLGYRGLNQDFLYQVNGGFLKSGYYDFDLLPEFSLFGGNAKLRLNRHHADLQGGKLQSKLRNDFFTGRSIEKKLSIKDIGYVKNTFYSIDTPSHSLTKDVDTIFVDDRNTATNRLDTKINYTIAGITGDFDPLINGVDYFIDYANGIVQFLSPRNRTDLIVLRLSDEEIIIQSDAVQNLRLENRYSVGPNILPGSFSLTIFDTLGQVHPLQEFGLDEDADGQVDAELINYDLGFLSFRQARPFPDAVYDDTINIYNLNIRFLSYSIIYYLSFKPLVKGSEKVLVDGQLMTQSNDYVIDYTSGILLFLRDDAVSDFSEIEVQYSSVERKGKSIFYSAQSNFSINNEINLAPGISVIDSTKVLHISGKLETGAKDKKSIKFIPQAAIDAKKAWAHTYSLIGNYEMLSVNAEYRGYTRDFSAFGSNEKKYGRLRHSGNIGTSIEPLSYLRLDAQFKQEYQLDSLNQQKVAQYTQGKINFLNPKFPNGYILLGKDNLPDYKKNRVQVNGNYDFQLLRTDIKLNSVIRTSIVDFAENNQDQLFEYIIKTNFSLPVPMRGSINFRYNNLANNKTRKQNDNELRGTLNFDLIPGIYYTGNYNLQTTSFHLTNSQNLSLQHYFYSNLNVAPGRWFSRLSIVNLSIGTGNNFDEYINNLSASYQKPLIIFNPLEIGTLSRINKTTNYYAAIQIMPYSKLLISIKSSMIRSANSYYSLPDLIPTLRNELRVEFEPGDFGIFITVWDIRQVQTYPVETTNNFYLEWSKPWSSLLRTKLTNNFRLTEDNYGMIGSTNSSIKSNLEALFRFTAKSFATINLGAERRKDNFDEVDYLISPGAGFNINLFKFLYLQGNYLLTYTLGEPVTHNLTIKVTGQF